MKKLRLLLCVAILSPSFVWGNDDLKPTTKGVNENKRTLMCNDRYCVENGVTLIREGDNLKLPTGEWIRGGNNWWHISHDQSDVEAGCLTVCKSNLDQVPAGFENKGWVPSCIKT